MFLIQKLPYRNSLGFLLGCICLALMMNCSGPEIRPTPQGQIPARLPSPSEPRQTIPSSPITTTTLPDITSIRITPPGFDTVTQIGWLLTTRDSRIAAAALEDATSYNIRAFHVGGDILKAVDDLIFIPELSRFVQNLSARAKEKEISTYIWSRELHLEGKSFSFNPAAPLVVARQAAYRTALANLPDVAGVVLSFQGAELEPWNAVIPEGQPTLPFPERIRFIIEMVRKVVVDELGKQLLIYTESANPEQKQWLTEAIQLFPTGSLSLLIPAGDSSLPPSFDSYPQWLEYDLVASSYFGDRFLFCMADEMAYRIKEARRHNLRGGIGKIDARGYSLAKSPNAVNQFLFSRFLSLPNVTLDSVLDEWIMQRYGLNSQTPAGRICKQILRTSSIWGRKMIQVKGLPVFIIEGDIPASRQNLLAVLNQPGINPSGSEAVKQELALPQKQTMVDLAQEAYEAMEGLENIDRDLESLRPDMNPGEYEKLRTRLDYQRRVAEVGFYAKQCLWGFMIWEKTMDEAEALHLEAHLQKLEKSAAEIEQKYGHELTPANPNRIRALVADIRRTFPRVLLGAKERPWNHLRKINIKPISVAMVEITWETDIPSQSRVFVGMNPWVFSNFVSESNTPTISHRIIVEGLQPGNYYYFKIQCVTENGEITNSGEFPLYLESSPIM